jgi:hypothetical protein
MSIRTNKTSRRKEESAVAQYHELRANVFCDSCPSGYACILVLKIPACQEAPAHSHPDLPCAQAFMVVPVTCNAICPLWMTDDPFVLSIFKDNERVYARQERG